MKYFKSWRIAAAPLLGVALLAVMLFASKPAATQDAAGKQFCVGCSADGKATPRTADGHPDFSGFWSGGVLDLRPTRDVGARGAADSSAAAPAAGANAAAPAAGGGAPNFGRNGLGQLLNRYDDGSIVFDFGTEYDTAERCNPLDEKCQAPNQPPYNETYMKKVKEIAKTEFHGTSPLDPLLECRPAGVPRAGLPAQMVQTPDLIIFFYTTAPYSTYRLIYMNGRPHPDMKDYETTYMGDSIGSWEGDTLVIDTIGFNDDTWLGGGGAIGNTQFTSIHSEKEHTIERLKRDGDVMTYDITVEDPEALTKPWVLPTRRMRHSGPGMEVPAVDALAEGICTPTPHLVLPTSEDRDIKEDCGYRCDKDQPKSPGAK